ncbi:uncharacterized [Tachysurus ichikawai]
MVRACPNKNNDGPNGENEKVSAEPVSTGPSGAGRAEAEPTVRTEPAVEGCAAGPADAGPTPTEPTNTGTSDHTPTPITLHTDNKLINSDIEQPESKQRDDGTMAVKCRRST